MTQLVEIFDGAADGANVSTTNSIFTGAVTGTAPVFDDDFVHATLVADFPGSQSMLIAAGSNQSNPRRDGFNTNQMAGSFYLYLADITPSALCIILHLRTSGGTNIAGLYLSTAGRLIAINNASGVITGSNIANHQLLINNWYRIDWAVTVNNGNANGGRVQYGIYDAQSDPYNTTPITTVFDSGSDETLGTTNIGRLYIGSVSNVTRDAGWWQMHWRTDDATSTLMGPPVPAPPPVVYDTIFINVGGVWKQAVAYINVGGVWKLAAPETA